MKNGSVPAQALAVPLYYSILENLLMGKPSTDSIVSLASDYTVKPTDSVVLIDATVSGRTVTLPPATNVLSVSGGTTKVLYIKKSDGTSNAVTIVPDPLDTIEGASSLVLNTAFQSTILVPDGNDWYILSSSNATPATTERYYAAKGFAAGNYYSTPAGTCQGSSSFTAAVTVRVKHLAAGSSVELFSCRRLFIGGGWGIGLDGNRAKLFITRGDGTKLENFVNANWDPTDNGNDMSSGSLIHLCLVYNGTDAILFANGRLLTTIGTVSFLPEAAVGATLGVIAFNQGNPFDGAILGASYHATALTEDQVFDHYLACVDANDHVNGGVSWTNRWSFNQESSAPATLEDLNGSIDMTRTGTLSIENLRGSWYKR